MFGRLKDDRQNIFSCIMSVSKWMLHTDIEKNNTRWRRSITEERLALTVRLAHNNL
jgi:hypothetical protein